MIHITSEAMDKIHRLREREGKKDCALRVGVTSGCCSQFSYLMQFDTHQHPDDHVFHFEDLKVVVDSESLPYLKGLEIGYLQNAHGEGFIFNNPNSRKTCGCGNSFDA